MEEHTVKRKYEGAKQKGKEEEEDTESSQIPLTTNTINKINPCHKGFHYICVKKRIFFFK